MKWDPIQWIQQMSKDTYEFRRTGRSQIDMKSHDSERYMLIVGILSSLSR